MRKAIRLLLATIVFLILSAVPAFPKNFIIYNSSNSSQLYFVVNGTTGNVGIGVVPEYSLDISGTGRFSSTLYISDGYPWAPSLTFYGDTNTGFYRKANDVMAAVANGQEALMFSGQTGVGTLAIGNIIPTNEKLLITGSGTADFVRISSQNDEAGDVFIVKRSGDVGIGTTSPAGKLHVSTSGNSNALVVNDSTGNVGIGTSSPIYKLQVDGNFIYLNGTTDSDLILNLPDTATYDPQVQLRVNNANKAGIIYDKNYDRARLYCGSGSIALLSNGNVGIGTTLPKGKLDVNGVSYFRNTVYIAMENENINRSNMDYTTLRNRITSNGTYYNRAITAQVVKGVDSGITDNGYAVGVWSEIFGGHTDYGYYLNGTLKEVIGINDVYGIHGENNTGIINYVYGLHMRPYAESGTINNLYDIYISSPVTGGTINNHYSIYQADSSSKNYFAGNVGIGAVSPVWNLEVAGHEVGHSAVIGITAASPNDVATMVFGDSDMKYAGQVRYDNSDDSMRFWTNGSEKVRIDASGDVGIGVTTPDGKLNIVGTQAWTSNGWRKAIRLDGFSAIELGGGGSTMFGAGVSSNKLYYFYTATEDSSSDSAHYYMAADSSGNVGIGTTSPSEKLYVDGNIYATGSITQGSDIRLKEDVEPVLNVTRKIGKVGAYRYRWNSLAKKYGYNDNRTQIGLIAQELEKEFPELVHDVKHCTGEGENMTCETFKTIDYEHAVAVLWEAVREQDSKISSMEKRLEKLERMVNSGK